LAEGGFLTLPRPGCVKTAGLHIALCERNSVAESDRAVQTLKRLTKSCSLH